MSNPNQEPTLGYPDGVPLCAIHEPEREEVRARLAAAEYLLALRLPSLGVLRGLNAEQILITNGLKRHIGTAVLGPMPEGESRQKGEAAVYLPQDVWSEEHVDPEAGKYLLHMKPALVPEQEKYDLARSLTEKGLVPAKTWWEIGPRLPEQYQNLTVEDIVKQALKHGAKERPALEDVVTGKEVIAGPYVLVVDKEVTVADGNAAALWVPANSTRRDKLGRFEEAFDLPSTV